MFHWLWREESPLATSSFTESDAPGLCRTRAFRNRTLPDLVGPGCSNDPRVRSIESDHEDAEEPGLGHHNFDSTNISGPCRSRVFSESLQEFAFGLNDDKKESDGEETEEEFIAFNVEDYHGIGSWMEEPRRHAVDQ